MKIKDFFDTEKTLRYVERCTYMGVLSCMKVTLSKKKIHDESVSNLHVQDLETFIFCVDFKS